MRLHTCLSKRLLAVARKDLPENEVRKKGVALRNSALVGRGAGGGEGQAAAVLVMLPSLFPSPFLPYLPSHEEEAQAL